MKIKIAKTAECAYVHSDGHVVIIHREKHPRAGEVEWAEIIEKIDTHCSFDGRIVFHHPRYDRRLQLALEAYGISCNVPCLENGSDNSKRKGIEVGHFEIQFKDGVNLSWITMPGTISDDLTYQPDCKDVFNPEWFIGQTWGHSARIGKIHRLPKQVENQPSEIAA